MTGMCDTVRAEIVAARTRSAERMGQWRAGAEHRAMTAAFAGCSLDSAEPAAERAERLLEDGGWAEALLTPLLSVLAADPLFEPTFKASRDSLRIGAVLFDCPAASIAASVTSAAAMATLPAPETLVFSGRVAVTRTIRAGGARLRRWQAEPCGWAFSTPEARPCQLLEAIVLRDGGVHRTDGRQEAQLLCDAATDVVSLVATIRPGAAPLMREYDIATRALVRLADADDRPSRAAMLLACVRESQRGDAGSCFEAATHDPAFHLRWTAMREWLALDARAAARRLAEMAKGDPHPEICAAAAHMLDQVSQRLEAADCPG